MQILNVLTKLRKEMAETERSITQAWQRYSQELSTKALAEAEATTKRLDVYFISSSPVKLPLASVYKGVGDTRPVQSAAGAD